MYKAAGGTAGVGGSLATTGFNILGAVVGAVALLVFGFALIRTARRVPKSTD